MRLCAEIQGRNSYKWINLELYLLSFVETPRKFIIYLFIYLFRITVIIIPIVLFQFIRFPVLCFFGLDFVSLKGTLFVSTSVYKHSL